MFVPNIRTFPPVPLVVDSLDPRAWSNTFPYLSVGEVLEPQHFHGHFGFIAGKVQESLFRLVRFDLLDGSHAIRSVLDANQVLLIVGIETPSTGVERRQRFLEGVNTSARGFGRR